MLEGRTVVVTGTSRGLGAALVSAFASTDASVFSITRSDATGASGSGQESGNVYISDVTEQAGVERVFEDIVQRTGSIDILFNNAAVYPKVSFLEESFQDWMEAITINLGGVANCCKAALPYMIKSGYGRIYNIGSWADVAPIPKSSAYATSKGGLHALTKSIAADIMDLDLDIEVHEWIPGHLNTRMSDFTGIDPAVSAGWALDMVQSQASSRNCIFENDREFVPAKGIRARIRDAIYFWR